MRIDNFTLYIAVRDRQYNIPTVTKYYKDLDCNKIIFDSSVRKYDNENLIKKHGFSYVYFGPMTFWEKFKRINDRIQTDYVLDNPDDDVTLKPSIIKCVEFLQKNDDYSCAFGEIYGFKGQNIFPLFPKKHQGGLTLNFHSKSSFERINAFLTKCPIGINHAVFRSSVTKSFYNFIFDNENIQAVNFVERFLIIYAMIYGNWKVLPVLYQMRNRANDHVYKKHAKDMKIEKNLKKSLNIENLSALGKVLARESDNKDEQECFNFLKKTLSEHFMHKDKIGGDWCRVNCPSIQRDYDADIKAFKEQYLKYHE